MHICVTRPRWVNTLRLEQNVLQFTEYMFLNKTYYILTTQDIIGLGNGLLPVQCQAIIWANAKILSIGLLATNFNEILIEI